MKRKLTAREWMLLGVLAILVVVVGYVTLFCMPVTSARDSVSFATVDASQSVVRQLTSWSFL